MRKTKEMLLNMNISKTNKLYKTLSCPSVTMLSIINLMTKQYLIVITLLCKLLLEPILLMDLSEKLNSLKTHLATRWRNKAGTLSDKLPNWEVLIRKPCLQFKLTLKIRLLVWDWRKIILNRKTIFILIWILWTFKL